MWLHVSILSVSANSSTAPQALWRQVLAFKWKIFPWTHERPISDGLHVTTRLYICVYFQTPRVVATWCLYVCVCDVSLWLYILPPLGHSNCIFHMNVKHDLITIAIICEKTRGGRGRNRNSDTPGDIALPAQVSQCSVPFVNNEEVLSTFLCQKVPEQPLSFCLPFIFWTKFSICTVFYSGA